MSAIYHTEDAPQLICWDRSHYPTFADQLKAYENTRTVYVGNLSFFTTESQIKETFEVVGPVKRIIMGLNRETKQPCGFCFVEYYTIEAYMACLKYLSETVCDDRVVRCDADGGFKPGRQFGRGKSGGQVRDERTRNNDPARGGVLEIVLPGSRKRGRDDRDDQDERRGGGGDRRDRDRDRDSDRRGGGGDRRDRDRDRDRDRGGDKDEFGRDRDSGRRDSGRGRDDKDSYTKDRDPVDFVAERQSGTLRTSR